MVAKSLTGEQKSNLAKDIGKVLVRKHGKQKYYSSYRVQQAIKETRWDIDYVCWAMCIFTSPAEFNSYHKRIGESCNYEAMNIEMREYIKEFTSEPWFDFDFSFDFDGGD